MQRSLVPFLALSALLLFTACTYTYGNKEIIDPEQVARLHEGKSTKQDILSTLGQPSDVEKTSDDQTKWTYRYREAKNNIIAGIPLYGINILAGGRNGDLCTRSLTFDQKSILRSNQYHQEEFYTSALFSLGRRMNNSFITTDGHQRTKAEMDALGKPFDEDKAYENQLLERAM